MGTKLKVLAALLVGLVLAGGAVVAVNMAGGSSQAHGRLVYTRALSTENGIVNGRRFHTIYRAHPQSFLAEGRRACDWATRNPSTPIDTVDDARSEYLDHTTALAVIPGDGHEAWRGHIATIAWRTLCDPPFQPVPNDDED